MASPALPNKVVAIAKITILLPSGALIEPFTEIRRRMIPALGGLASASPCMAPILELKNVKTLKAGVSIAILPIYPSRTSVGFFRAPS